VNTSAPDRLSLPGWVPAIFAAAALAVCIFYTYALVAWVPAPGFNALNDTWDVVSVDSEVIGRNSILPGDRLLQIGSLTPQEYLANRTSQPFGGTQPGDVVRLVRQRNGQNTIVEWLMPTISLSEVVSRLSVSLPAVIFFIVGFLIHLLLRPRNQEWLLLVTFCYTTAIWLALGVVSSTGVAGSSPGLHATTWLFCAILLDLHLTFPRSIWQRHSRMLRPVLYGLAGVGAALELMSALPRSAYYVPLLLALLASLGLLIYHRQFGTSADGRTAAGLMLFGVGLALGPGVLLTVVPALLQHASSSTLSGYLSLFPIPLFPLFYAYAIYKRRLGSLEFRANRWLSLYAFLALYLTALVLVLVLGQAGLGPVSGGFLAYSILVAGIFVAFGSSARTAFQRFADRVAYGSRDIPENLVHMLANQIPTAHSRAALARLLAERITPSLFIRQSALYLFNDGAPDQLYANGLGSAETQLAPEDIQALVAGAGHYRPEMSDAAPDTGAPGTSAAGAPAAARWVLLAITLKLEQTPLGIWLFGRRDPDDYYPQRDIELLSTLASQVALASENLRLFQGVQLRLAELQALFDVSESLAKASSLAEILQAVVDRALICAPPASSAVIHRIEPESGLLVARAAAGDVSVRTVPPHLYADHSLAGRAMREQRRLYAPDVEQDSDYIAGSLSAGSLVCIPLVVSDEVLGNLSVASPRRQAFGSDDLRVLESLGHQAAVAIKKAQVTDSLVDSLAVVRQRSAELEASVARLKSTQLQLVQAGKLAAMGTLSAGLAHEINNPLAAIKMYAQNLKRSQQRGNLTDALLSKNLVSIDTLTDKISHVITHFRDFSRQSSNTFKSVAINEPLLSALDMFGEQLALRNITVTTRLAEQLPPVWGDANQLEQVMVNLIANARDALAEQECRELRLSTLSSNGHVVVEVSDSGNGIPPAVMAHIFEPFYTTKEAGHGTGLGLPISRSIVEDHQGRFEVESTPGQGTTFRILLPTQGGHSG
jgi:signal transduction histidine kinase